MRGQLNIHFFFLNLMMKLFVEDGNDIMLQEHIVAAISFHGGGAGTSCILLNCDNLNELAIDKKLKTSNIGSRATHKIRWFENKVLINEASGIATPEVILDNKLVKHRKSLLDAQFGDSSMSDKLPLFIQENNNRSAATYAISDNRMSTKIYQMFLNSGVYINSSLDDQEVSLVTGPGQACSKWDGYPGNNPNELSKECLVKLKELYDIGKVNRK